MKHNLVPFLWMAGMACIALSAWHHRMVTIEDIEEKLGVSSFKRPYGIKDKEIMLLIKISEGEKRASLKKALQFRKLSHVCFLSSILLWLVLPFIE